MLKHGTKTTPVFLPADGEASWSLLPGLVSLLSGSTVQPENTYSSILKVTGQMCKSQKRININTNHTSINLPKPVSTDLTIMQDSVLTNPVGKLLDTNPVFLCLGGKLMSIFIGGNIYRSRGNMILDI